MLYTAYLIMCMVGPLGSGGCAPAAKPLTFETRDLCEKYIMREVGYYKSGVGLESMRPHLPSMTEGKLRIKARCSVDILDEWLGVDMPEVKHEELSSTPREKS
jgi:hypothetical protein